MKYRKKPVEVDAIQWTGNNLEEAIEFLGDDYAGRSAERHPNGKSTIYVQSMEGVVRGEKGCMLVRDIKGEYYVYDYDIFLNTHEPVTSDEGKLIQADDYSNIFTAEEWLELLNAGFNSDDGTGYWGYKQYYDNDTCCFDNQPEGYTHVHWYNV